jgi:hypothetical protein
MLIALLSETLPADAKLVLVASLRPAAFAGVKTDPAWRRPPALQRPMVTEDLLHVVIWRCCLWVAGDDGLFSALRGPIAKTRR